MEIMCDKYQRLISSSWLSLSFSVSLTHSHTHTHTHTRMSTTVEAGRELARLKIQRVKQSVVAPRETNYTSNSFWYLRCGKEPKALLQQVDDTRQKHMQLTGHQQLLQDKVDRDAQL